MSTRSTSARWKSTPLWNCRCRVREIGSRRVTFTYQLELADTGVAIADAETTLISLDTGHRLTRLPDAVIEALGGGVRSDS